MNSPDAAMPHDIVSALYLVSHWLRNEGIAELRIDPGPDDSPYAVLTRLFRHSNSEASPPAKRRERRTDIEPPKRAHRIEGLSEHLLLAEVESPSGLRDIRMRKRCPICRKILSVEAFARSRPTSDGRCGICRVCTLNIRRKRRIELAESEDRTAAARFWPKVDQNAPGGCWLWRAAVDGFGYPRFYFKAKEVPAYKVASELTGMPFPIGKIGRPTCGNRKCVNPKHVIAITRRQLSLEHAKDNPFRRNALATHCIRGHAFSPDNVWHFKVNKGICRACLKCWALRHPGKTSKKPNRRCDAIAPKHARLINKAAPLLAQLPRAIRDDATSILHIEILSGSVAKDKLAHAIGAAKRQAWKMQPDKWRTSSLDEPLAGGGTLLDRIADDAFADDLADTALAGAEDQ